MTKHQEAIDSKLTRNFTQIISISKHLICIFCQDTFYDPTRLSCGHTFCEVCIKEWIKSNNLCPICRKKFVKSNTSKDLIATNIINDLEVSCNNNGINGCPWKGVLSELERHLSVCRFDECVLPESMKIIFKKVFNCEMKANVVV